MATESLPTKDGPSLALAACHPNHGFRLAQMTVKQLSLPCPSSWRFDLARCARACMFAEPRPRTSLYKDSCHSMHSIDKVWTPHLGNTPHCGVLPAYVHLCSQIVCYIRSVHTCIPFTHCLCVWDVLAWRATATLSSFVKPLVSSPNASHYAENGMELTIH